MIIAGLRPPEYDAALRAERARRAAAAGVAESPDQVSDSQEWATSAVDIAPRPPAD